LMKKSNTGLFLWFTPMMYPLRALIFNELPIDFRLIMVPLRCFKGFSDECEECYCCLSWVIGNVAFLDVIMGPFMVVFWEGFNMAPFWVRRVIVSV